MWQGSLPHKKGAGANNDVRFILGQRFPEIFEKRLLLKKLDFLFESRLAGSVEN